MSTCDGIVHELANPVKPRVMITVNEESFKDVTLLTGRGIYGDDCTNFFAYRADPRRYDTGDLIAVYYERNTEVEDCIENALLDEEENQLMSCEFFHDNILPGLKISHPLTWVKYRTVSSGEHMITYDRPEDHAIVYLPLPSLDTIPIVTIAELCKMDWNLCHATVNIVTVNDSSFAFHHFGEPHLSLLGHDDEPDKLLEEVRWLSSFDSPYIAKLSHLVTDATGYFRGYLVPFCPGGNMSRAFDDLHNVTNDDKVRAHDDKEEQPRVAASLELVFPLKGTGYAKRLSWAVKMQWAIEILEGTVTLHAASCFTGDLKLQNVLLSPEGHMLLIDIKPLPNGYSEDYVPPEIDILAPPTEEDLELERAQTFPLTAARDVFAVGLMLWQISEEIGWFLRDDVRYAPRLPWADGEGSAPEWYRHLAASCVQRVPEARPTAQQVLAILRGHLYDEARALPKSKAPSRSIVVDVCEVTKIHTMLDDVAHGHPEVTRKRGYDDQAETSDIDEEAARPAKRRRHDQASHDQGASSISPLISEMRERQQEKSSEAKRQIEIAETKLKLAVEQAQREHERIERELKIAQQHLTLQADAAKQQLREIRMESYQQTAKMMESGDAAVRALGAEFLNTLKDEAKADGMVI